MKNEHLFFPHYIFKIHFFSYFYGQKGNQRLIYTDSCYI